MTVLFDDDRIGNGPGAPGRQDALRSFPGGPGRVQPTFPQLRRPATQPVLQGGPPETFQDPGRAPAGFGPAGVQPRPQPRPMLGTAPGTMPLPPRPQAQPFQSVDSAGRRFTQATPEQAAEMQRQRMASAAQGPTLHRFQGQMANQVMPQGQPPTLGNFGSFLEQQLGAQPFGQLQQFAGQQLGQDPAALARQFAEQQLGAQPFQQAQQFAAGRLGQDPFGAAQQFAQQGLAAPSRFDMPAVQQAVQFQQQFLGQQAEEAAQRARAQASERGVFFGTPGIQLEQQARRPFEQELGRFGSELVLEQARTQAQDRAAALQGALGAGGAGFEAQRAGLQDVLASQQAGFGAGQAGLQGLLGSLGIGGQLQGQNFQQALAAQQAGFGAQQATTGNAMQFLQNAQAEQQARAALGLQSAQLGFQGAPDINSMTALLGSQPFPQPQGIPGEFFTALGAQGQGAQQVPPWLQQLMAGQGQQAPPPPQIDMASIIRQMQGVQIPQVPQVRG